MGKLYNLFFVDPKLIETHVPLSVGISTRDFVVELSPTEKITVHCPDGYQAGDVVFIDEKGNVKNTWNNEVRAWLWYCFARAPVYPFFLSYAVVFLLELAKSQAQPNGKVRFAGVEVSPNSTFTLALVICYIFMALTGPMLGAMADFSPYRKQLFGFFAILGSFCCFLLIPALKEQNLGASLFLGTGIMYCYEGSLNFIYAYLPEISRARSIPRISAVGIAITNAGQILSLAIFLPVMIGGGDVEKKGSRDGHVLSAMAVCLVVVGVWWAGLSIFSYTMLHPRPSRRPLPQNSNLLTIGFTELYHVRHKIRQHPDLFKFLVAYMFCVLALNTLTSSVVVIFNGDFGWGSTAIAIAFVVAQLLASGGAIGAIRTGKKFGLRKTILFSLFVFAIVCPFLCILYDFRANCTVGNFDYCKDTGKCLARYHVTSFSDASSTCSDLGSDYHLIFPNSPELSVCSAKVCGAKDCLLGFNLARDQNDSLIWRFQDGSMPTFWNTPDSQPIPTPTNDSRPLDSFCIASIFSKNHFWQNVDCNADVFAICEKPAELQGTFGVNVFAAIGLVVLATFNGVLLSMCRAYFATMVPADLEAEMFGLFSLANKIFVWTGLLIFAVANESSGNYRWGVLGMSPFFVLSIVFLWKIDDRVIADNLQKHMASRRQSLRRPISQRQVCTPQRQHTNPIKHDLENISNLDTKSTPEINPTVSEIPQILRSTEQSSLIVREVLEIGVELSASASTDSFNLVQ